MTTVTQAQLVAPQLLAATDLPLTPAIVPSNTVWKIGRPVFCNTSAGAVQLTAGISAVALTPATTFISARTLAPGETYVSPELAGQVLPPGSGIRAFGNVNISVVISGLSIA